MVTKSKSFENFISSPPETASSKVLEADPVVIELLDEFFEAYTSGRTTKTIQAFHRFLSEEYSIAFSCDTLKRYCKKHKPQLWNAYKEVRSGKRIINKS